MSDNSDNSDFEWIRTETIPCDLPCHCSPTPDTSSQKNVLHTTLTLGPLSVTLSNLGASIHSLRLGGSDVVLGFDRPSDCARIEDNPYFGCTIGRVANRIKGGRFCPGAGEDTVALPDLNSEGGRNHLHGGRVGWSRRLWSPSPGRDHPTVAYSLHSPHGEDGYAGAVEAVATYRLVRGEKSVALRLEMTCRLAPGERRTTPVNMAQHAYFNLADDGGDVREHVLRVRAEQYTPNDDTHCPTGAVRRTERPHLDWSAGKPIGRGLAEYAAHHGLEENEGPWGFDHNYVPEGQGMREVAILSHPASGRRMRVRTDAPGIQVYTANYLDGIVGKNERVYKRWDGVCLETQAFPNSIGDGLGIDESFAKGKCFILRKGGEEYRHTVEYCFDDP